MYCFLRFCLYSCGYFTQHFVVRAEYVVLLCWVSNVTCPFVYVGIARCYGFDASHASAATAHDSGCGVL